MNKKNADLLEISNSTHPTPAARWTAMLKGRKIGGGKHCGFRRDDKRLHKMSTHQAAAMLNLTGKHIV